MQHPAYTGIASGQSASASLYDSTYNTANNAAGQVVVTELEMVKGRLQEVLSFANMQGALIEDIRSKLLGGGQVGGKDCTNTVRPVPSGLIGQLNQILDDVMAQLQQTDANVTHLRGSI